MLNICLATIPFPRKSLYISLFCKTLQYCRSNLHIFLHKMRIQYITDYQSLWNATVELIPRNFRHKVETIELFVWPKYSIITDGFTISSLEYRIKMPEKIVIFFSWERKFICIPVLVLIFPTYRFYMYGQKFIS